MSKPIVSALVVASALLLSLLPHGTLGWTVPPMVQSRLPATVRRTNLIRSFSHDQAIAVTVQTLAKSLPQTPRIIQGGMGIRISSWKLAREVARQGELGVISGTAMDTIFVRELQSGTLV